MQTTPSKKLEGLIAASFTPYRNGCINPDIVPAYAAALRSQGVQGIFVNGTTGESLSLSTDERKALAEAWLSCAAPGFPVLVHVGHNSLPEACDLAAHAAEHGARAVSAMAPTFFQPGLPALVDYLAEIAAAAPAVPFYYYHMPSMTGARFLMTDFLRLAGERIPNLAGIKFTWEDLMDYTLAAGVDGGRYDIVFGRDEILLCGLALGARAAIGSTYNMAAPLYRAVWSAFDAGRLAEARELQVRAMAMIDACRRSGPSDLPAIRALASQRLGVELGPPRAPLVPARDEALTSLGRTLDGLLVGLPTAG
jgi:N-acetylneuraminate lyase